MSQGARGRVWVIGLESTGPSARDFSAALNLAQSLRWFGGRASQDPVLLVQLLPAGEHHEPADALTASRVSLPGVEVVARTLNASEPRALAAMKAAATRYPEHLLVCCQPFALVLGDPVDHLPADSIGVSPFDVLPWAVGAFTEWFKRIGLDATPVCRTRFDGAPTPPLASGDLLVVPHRLLEALDQQWSRWMPDVAGRYEELAGAVTRPQSILLQGATERLALSCALASALPWTLLPSGFDVPCYMSGGHFAGSTKPVTIKHLPTADPDWTTAGQATFPSGPHAGAELFDRLRSWTRVGEGEELSPSAATCGPRHRARREGLRWDRGIGVPQRLEGPRILIASAPRCGNNWLSHLLGSLYDLPVATAPATLEELVATRWDRFVMYQHFIPSPALMEWGRDQGVRFITLVRHPADMFLSLFHFVNRMAELGNREILGQHSFAKLIGQSLDSDATLSFIREDFDELRCSLAWLQSESAIVVRYEDLVEQPEAALASLTQRIGPVDSTRFARAVESCSKDKLRSKSEFLRVVVREGVAGEGVRTLPVRHLAAIHARYGDWMAALGYD